MFLERVDDGVGSIKVCPPVVAEGAECSRSTREMVARMRREFLGNFKSPSNMNTRAKAGKTMAASGERVQGCPKETRVWLVGENYRKKGTRGNETMAYISKHPGVTRERLEKSGHRWKDVTWDIRTRPGTVEIQRPGEVRSKS